MVERETKFVFFDLGGVFFSFRSSFLKLASRYGKSESDFRRLFEKHDRAACRGDLGPQELWRKYEKELDISSSGFDFGKFWVENFSPIPETHSLAEEVGARLLTNVYPSVFEETLKRGFVPDLGWKTVVKSCDLGLVKPEGDLQVRGEKSGSESGKYFLCRRFFSERARSQGGGVERGSL